MRKALIQLHASVFIAGFTGLFGKLITYNEVDIVWYRMLFTTLILLVFTGVPHVPFKKILKLAGCGALLGLHWMLFYASIKASNVSIGVVCFALVGFFTAILEPLLNNKRISVREILVSLITLLGIVLIFFFRQSLPLRYYDRCRFIICKRTVSCIEQKVYTRYSESFGIVLSDVGGLIGVSLIIPIYLAIFPRVNPY